MLCFCPSPMEFNISKDRAICFILFICYSASQIKLLRTSLAPSSSFQLNGVKQRALKDLGHNLHSNSPVICDRSDYRFDLCLLNGGTTLYPTNCTLLVDIGSTNILSHMKEKIRPYPRKWEIGPMNAITEFTLSTSLQSNDCQVFHEAPALIFSTGAYTGNFYHDFADGFVPLFVTLTSLFVTTPLLVIADSHDWWFSRYREVLNRLTDNQHIIDLKSDNIVHCFPFAVIGLVSHGDMTIDSSRMPNSESLRDFQSLLHLSYYIPPKHPPSYLNRPRLTLIARTGSVGRVILNQDEIIQAADEVGFRVSIFTPTTKTSLAGAHELISQSQALLGVHGAALTHIFFLQPPAIFIQIVPLGLEWASETCFGRAAMELGLYYIKYKVAVQESTLVDKYSKDDIVLMNPKAVVKKGWNYTKLYLKEQDIVLDVGRIRSYLTIAYDKAMETLEDMSRSPV